jgi:hypothetical protein
MTDALHTRSTRPHTWHTMPVALQMNGQLWRGEVRAEETLLELVRERLRLTGTKRSCESQVCGASGRASRRAPKSAGNGGWMAYIAAPDGVSIELVHRTA